MNNRARVIGIVILLILAVLLFSFFIRGCSWGKTNNSGALNNENIDAGNTNAIATLPLTPQNVKHDGVNATLPDMTNKTEQAPAGIEQTAMDFAERYGSYSTDSDYANLYDLWPLMTEKMQKSTEAIISTEKAKNSTNNKYVGVSSKSVSVELNEYKENSAKALVALQRVETTIEGSKTYYQNLLLAFVKIGTNWLVDSAVWKK